MSLHRSMNHAARVAGALRIDGMACDAIEGDVTPEAIRRLEQFFEESFEGDDQKLQMAHALLKDLIEGLAPGQGGSGAEDDLPDDYVPAVDFLRKKLSRDDLATLKTLMPRKATDEPPDFPGKPKVGGGMTPEGYARALDFAKSKMSRDDAAEFEKILREMVSPKNRMAGDRLAFDADIDRQVSRVVEETREKRERNFADRWPNAASIAVSG